MVKMNESSAIFQATKIRRSFFCGAVAVFALFAVHGNASGDEVSIRILWGIRPTAIQQYNGTTFRTASNSEWNVSSFNDRFCMRLAFAGNGTFDGNAGFSSLQWVGPPEAAEHSTVVWPGSKVLTGDFAVYCTTNLPITWLGDIDVVDPDEEIYDDEDDYYAPLWHDAHFVSLVCETATRRVWRISETPGGTDFATMSPVTNKVTMSFALYPDSNRLNIIPSVDRQAVYFGAEIPQRCVWMADKGLTTNDLAGCSESTLALATALDMLPADVEGGVELKIDSISLSGGEPVRDGGSGSWTATLNWEFKALDASGTASDVSSLRSGATLWLETAESVTDLGTANSTRTALDPSAGAATVSGSGSSLFARLVLETEP